MVMMTMMVVDDGHIFSLQDGTPTELPTSG